MVLTREEISLRRRRLWAPGTCYNKSSEGMVGDKRAIELAVVTVQAKDAEAPSAEDFEKPKMIKASFPVVPLK